ncbi:conserved hypothetical protein [Pseudoalteromonas sp. 3J6]|uniref:hypothetical protein n=1 Tax=unclassified Pseudoalteromonas TaxID=194690 RepID=UPI001768EE35|nr:MULTISPECIES: hypothetical protein [unclassified Pseudoalteromonas]MCK8129923.1 hypothetical protein [Pseudoalteromonas sp. 2CM39R]CAD2225027.1 conserved hypothetical protein [Pseudoalteromonas sp. 3J6]
MAVYSIVSNMANKDFLQELIESKYPGDLHCTFSELGWFLHEPLGGSVKEVSDKLVGEGDTKFIFVITTVDSFWGVQPNSVWDWLQPRVK